MKFLVPVDFSDITNPLLRTVKLIAWKHNAEVYLLHVISPVVYLPYPETLNVSVIDIEILQEIEKEKKSEAEEKLKGLMDFLSPIRTESYIEIGQAADIILEYEEKLNPDIVFLGSHKKGLIEKILIGSTTEKVIKHGRKSDFVIKGGGVSFTKSVVIAYDFSETAQRAVDFAVEFLKPFSVKVKLLHVNEPLELPIIQKLKKKVHEKFSKEKIKILEEITERFKNLGIEAEIIFKEGERPVEEIANVVNNSEDVELLIVGSRGLSGLRRIILGSTTSKLLSKINKPIFVYKV